MHGIALMGYTIDILHAVVDVYVHLPKQFSSSEQNHRLHFEKAHRKPKQVISLLMRPFAW